MTVYPWLEGAAEAAAAAATTRARELEEELAGVLQESEALIKEKEALVREVNIRAQELVEDQTQVDQVVQAQQDISFQKQDTQ